jgi:hypothetical protein
MIKFVADRVSIRGPRVDGTYVVSFDVGEYEKDKLAQLIMVEDNLIVAVDELSNYEEQKD